MQKRMVFVLLALLLTAASAAAKEGFYVGAGFVHDRMQNSDFGSLNSAVGLDLRFGYTFASFSLEGNIVSSKHDDKRTGYGDTSFGGLSIDFKIPFTQPEQLNQFYVLAGLGGYSLRGYDPVAGGDAKYSGGGFDLGAGVEHYFNQHVAFDLQAVYRAIKYDKKEAQGTTTTLTPKLNGDVLSIQAGVNYHF